MSKPNSKSVTATPCECGYLERNANDPDMPFKFDDTVNEYHFIYNFHGRDAELMIYHCPWCGGVASDSHRASLFHDLNEEACDEITKKTRSCVSLEDVIALLGQPDQDEFKAIKHIETVERAPRIEQVRQVTYRHLYEDLSVGFVQQIDGTICRVFMSKPLKKA